MIVCRFEHAKLRNVIFRRKRQTETGSTKRWWTSVFAAGCNEHQCRRTVLILLGCVQPIQSFREHILRACYRLFPFVWPRESPKSIHLIHDGFKTEGSLVRMSLIRLLYLPKPIELWLRHQVFSCVCVSVRAWPISRKTESSSVRIHQAG